ncbi:hypothetical protein ACLOJK_008565 [Asimina triloba]
MVEFRDTLLPTSFSFSNAAIDDYGRRSVPDGGIQRRGKGKPERKEEEVVAGLRHCRLCLGSPMLPSTAMVGDRCRTEIGAGRWDSKKVKGEAEESKEREGGGGGRGRHARDGLSNLEPYITHSTKAYLLWIASVLKACPVLQKLDVNVEISGFFGLHNQMELAAFILNNAVGLEPMVISNYWKSMFLKKTMIANWCRSGGGEDLYFLARSNYDFLWDGVNLYMLYPLQTIS